MLQGLGFGEGSERRRPTGRKANPLKWRAKKGEEGKQQENDKTKSGFVDHGLGTCDSKTSSRVHRRADSR